MTFDNPIRQPWDGMVAHTGVYVRYEGRGRADETGTQFLVFAVNCAHLGCPVEWFPQSGLFMCPCHGGVYYANGERASGPPPRGPVPLRLAGDRGRPSWRSRRRTTRRCRTRWNKHERERRPEHAPREDSP